MLDQNTDRMWFVIGALVVGAGIILITNKLFPQMFSQVVNAFEKPLSSVDDALDMAGFGNITWIRTVNDFSELNHYGYKGATLITTPNQNVEGWSDKGTRVQSTSGEHALKAVYDVLMLNEQNDGFEYVYMINVKNNGDRPITINNNKGDSRVLEPGQKDEFILDVVDSPDHHIQIKLSTSLINENLDATISNLRLGYYNDRD